MTYTGRMVPLNRYGMRKDSPHVLSRASNEKTMEQFIEAAVFEEEDPLVSVSSMVGTGRAFRGGTGMVDLVMDAGAETASLIDMDFLGGEDIKVE
jgi:DNA-directed RNA polymerase II subunit RPB1